MSAIESTLGFVRIDKWLWSVRVFKTRAQAMEACRAGHVKIDGQSVKPARGVRVGEVIHAWNGHLTRVVRVLALLEIRVGARRVPEFLEELTPPEERERRADAVSVPVSLVPRTRPGKRDRRRLTRFKEGL